MLMDQLLRREMQILRRMSRSNKETVVLPYVVGVPLLSCRDAPSGRRRSCGGASSSRGNRRTKRPCFAPARMLSVRVRCSAHLP